MNLELVYKKICERGQVRILEKSLYSENHHILPRCMGGDNSKSNLTKLTTREHFICHKILCVLYPNNEKLRYAFWAMCNQKNNRDYIVSSRDYEYAKLLCLEFWKKPKSPESVKKGADKRRGVKVDYRIYPNRIQNGTLNHNHGRFWITEVSTGDSKMVSKNDIIPKGWKVGRTKVGSLGNPNSIGKKWYNDPMTGEEKYFGKEELVPKDWVIGRSKKLKIGGDNLSGKICYYSIELNKEKYFSEKDIIPEGWIRGKLRKRSWFHNPELNEEKLLDINSTHNGFIPGRLPKFPFSESIESKNISIRTFKSDTDENLLVWHRDREDRIVEATHQTDWLVQIDNQLPQSLNSEVFIPKGVYHRVIKGTGDLEIKVQKLA